MASTKTRHVILLLLVALLCMSIVHARFDVNIMPVRNRILLNETALFNVTIVNRGVMAESFLMSGLDVEWSMGIIPVSANPMFLQPLETGRAIVSMHPAPGVTAGSRALSLFVKSLATGESQQHALYVDVRPGSIAESQYLPDVRINASIVTKIVDPRQPLEIDVHLENLNKRELGLVRVTATSAIFNKEYETSLAPLGTLGAEKTLRMKFDFPSPSQAPASDVLRLQVFVITEENVYALKPFELRYTIKEYESIDTRETVEKGFLSKTTTVWFTNNGNVPKLRSYFIDMPPLRSLFSHATPAAKSAEIERKTYWKWDLSLGVGETQSIEYRTSYQPLFWILVLIAIALGVYYTTRSPIVISKRANILHHAHGAISEIKIIISIKNRSTRKVRDLTIIDKVPNILAVLREEHVGSVIPDKVVSHEHRGTLVQWNVERIDPGEERMLVYKAKSKLPVLGDFSLQSTKVRFMNSRNMTRTAYSAAVNLKIEQQR